MQDSPIVEQLNSVIANKTVDEVLVALPIDKYGPLVHAIVRQCEEQGIIVRVRTEMSTLHIGRSYVKTMGPIALSIVQEHIAALGESRYAFPENRIEDLMKSLEAAITDDELRSFSTHLFGNRSTSLKG